MAWHVAELAWCRSMTFRRRRAHGWRTILRNESSSDTSSSAFVSSFLAVPAEGADQQNRCSKTDQFFHTTLR
jgi:hypothetical protein